MEPKHKFGTEMRNFLYFNSQYWITTVDWEYFFLPKAKVGLPNRCEPHKLVLSFFERFYSDTILKKLVKIQF